MSFAINSDRITFFFVVLQPENGITPGVLQLLAGVHRELERTLPYLDEVTSLVNGRVLRADGDTLITEDLMASPPGDSGGSKPLVRAHCRQPALRRSSRPQRIEHWRSFW